MRTTLAAIAALLAAAPALATDYPRDPEEQDKLCEVIGEAPNLSIPPLDRLWFKENCTCGATAVGCGRIPSKRFGERLEAARKSREEAAPAAAKRNAEEKARREAAKATEAERRAKIGPARKATAAVRAAFWACSDGPPADCNEPARALENACRAHGLRVVSWESRTDECYAQDGGGK